MYRPNLKSVVLPVLEIIGGILKNWAVPGYAHAPFLSKFLMGFVRMDPVNVPAKFEVRSFTRSAEIIAGTEKLRAVAGYAVQGRPRSLILVPSESAHMTSY